MTYAVNLLGPFEALDPTRRRISLPTRKAETLLAVLALSSRGGVPRDRILNLLWGERAEAHARHSLSQTLTSLRGAFGKEAIVADRDAISLATDHLDVDVLQFLRAVKSDDPTELQRAATLYRGALLDGLALRETAFQQWIDLERRRLAALGVDALTRLGGLLASRGDDAGAARAFERALIIDPLADAAHAALMRFHLDRGQIAHVARHYEHCLGLYRRELDAGPGPDIVGLAKEAAERPLRTRAWTSDPRPALATDATATVWRRDQRRYPALVVLPFTSFSADRHFAHGIADEISLALFRLKEFRVIDRQSALARKGNMIDVRRAGVDPGATYVMQGRVRSSGPRYRILIQLVNAETRVLLWGQRFEATASDDFSSQDRIANEVVSAVRQVVRNAEIELARRKPEGLDAYQLVLRAYPHLWSQDRLRNREAIRLLRRSIELDPDYARAHALLAWCLTQEIVYFWSTDPGEDRDLALRAIEAAIPCIDDDPTAMAAIGAALSQCGDQGRAAEWLDRALVLDPNNAWAWGRHGYVALYSNDPEGAKQRFHRSLALSPHDPFVFNMKMGIAMARGLEGAYPEAIAATRDVLNRYPSVTWANRLLASYCALTKEIAPARIALKKLIVATPNMSVRAMKDTHPMRHIPRYYDRLVEGLERSGLR
jgi:TolB-like protein/Tfp pilus assembly protein PilF